MGMVLTLSAVILSRPQLCHTLRHLTPRAFSTPQTAQKLTLRLHHSKTGSADKITDSKNTYVSADKGAIEGSNWRRYMVEFRDIEPYFRYAEVIDAAAAVLGHSDSLLEKLNLEEIIPAAKKGRDHQTPAVGHGDEYDKGDLNPRKDGICAYITLPNDEIAGMIAERCSLIRSIVDVWAVGKTIAETASSASMSYDNRIRRHFPEENSQDKSWRVIFRRYGRSRNSGLDYGQKRQLLLQFNDVFDKIDGTVDLMSPKHDLLLLEDWRTFHEKVVMPTNVTREISRRSIEDRRSLDEKYEPNMYIFGKIIKEGPSIYSAFEVKKRPYIGTTTMDAVSAHLSAIAARVPSAHAHLPPSTGSGTSDSGRPFTVLDPFCGTGSLLIACAHLGANVVGSDIDVDCLGLAQFITDEAKAQQANGDSNDKNTINNNSVARSKNSNFRRRISLKGSKDGEVSTAVAGEITDGNSFKKIDLNLKHSTRNNRKPSLFWPEGSYSTQQNGSSAQNFFHYGLDCRLVALVGTDVEAWDFNRDDSMSFSPARVFPIEDRSLPSLSPLTVSSKEGSVEVRPEYRLLRREKVGNGRSVEGLSVPAAFYSHSSTENESIQGVNIEALEDFGMFDAIVTDPPFGRREQALSSIAQSREKSEILSPLSTQPQTTNTVVDSSFSNTVLLSTLFSIADKRIRPGGRLVFWLPTEAFISEVSVRKRLSATLDINVGEDMDRVADKRGKFLSLKFVRATRQELNDSLWRWLVVYEKCL